MILNGKHLSINFRTHRPALYLVVIFLTGWWMSPAEGAELPQIELPEYIIAGIERAARLEGRRLATEATADIAVPDLRAAERPGLAAGRIWMPPSRPSLQFEPGRGCWRARLTGGGFQLFGAGVEMSGRRGEVSLAGRGRFEHSPQRTEAGSGWQVGMDVTAARRAWGQMALAPHAGFSRTTFKLNTDSSEEDRSWSDLRLGLNAAPIYTPLGRLSSRLAYGWWDMSEGGELDGSLVEFGLEQSAGVRDGTVEAALSLASGPVSDGEGDLGLAGFKAAYTCRPVPEINLRAGGYIYIGRSAEDHRREGGGLHFGIEHLPSFGGVATLAWRPQAELVFLRSLMKYWPMVQTSARGRIVEDVARLSLGYRRQLADRLNGRLDFGWRESRHVPFPVPDSATVRIESRRLRTLRTSAELEFTFGTGTTVALYASTERARTDGNGSGDRAPQRPPATVGMKGGINLVGCRFESDLVWTSETPIDFDGNTERPARVVWNISSSRNVRRGLVLTAGMDNLLDEHYYDIPGYDAPPMTFYLRLKMGGVWVE